MQMRKPKSAMKPMSILYKSFWVFQDKYTRNLKFLHQPKKFWITDIACRRICSTSSIIRTSSALVPGIGFRVLLSPARCLADAFNLVVWSSMAFGKSASFCLASVILVRVSLNFIRRSTSCCCSSSSSLCVASGPPISSSNLALFSFNCYRLVWMVASMLWRSSRSAILCLAFWSLNWYCSRNIAGDMISAISSGSWSWISWKHSLISPQLATSASKENPSRLAMFRSLALKSSKIGDLVLLVVSSSS